MNCSDRPGSNPNPSLVGVEHIPSSAEVAVIAMLEPVVGRTAAAVVLATLNERGWVCVPRVPTKAMVDEAWARAESENAAWVWRDMIKGFENPSTPALETQAAGVE
jgi:hypothetical protein